MKYLSTVLFLILVVVAGIYFFVLAGEDPTKTRLAETYADWQGGKLFTGRVEREDKPTTYKLQWVKGKEVINVTAAWEEMPVFKKVSDDRIAVIVGKTKDYNLQLWDSPRGPMIAFAFSDKQAAEKKLLEMASVAQPVKGK